MSQRFRKDKKAENAFNSLKQHAKARRIEFDLDLSYFMGLMDCAAAWDVQAEKRGDTVSLDRKQAHLGYIRGNVVVTTVSANTVKGNRERRLPEVVQALLARKRAKFQNLDAAYERRLAESGDPF